MKRLINRLSIGMKIMIGFGIVFAIFLIQSYMVVDSLKKVEQSNAKLDELLSSTILILDIDKDISEIQKLSLVYDQSGSSRVIKKLRELNQSISLNLDQISVVMRDEEEQRLTEQLSMLASGFSEHITYLEDRYQFRKKLLRKDLPNIRKEGAKYFKQIIARNQNRNRFAKMSTAEQLLQLWLEAHIDAFYFIERREYRLKKSVLDSISKMKQLGHSFRNKKINKKIARVLNEFRSTFDKTTQANRIYLSLINVVISGETLEFSTLSGELREMALAKLNRIARQNELIIKKRESQFMLSILLFIPLYFIIALLYRNNISKPIKRISETFVRLRDGEFDSAVPGQGRGDEIGNLANAADDFKNMSINLRKSVQKAEELTKIKSEFLANMSHEIRTPMNGVLGMISLLKETKLDLKQAEMLNTISSCGDSLLTILNDILDLSKVDSGNIVLEKESFNLDDCLQEIFFLFDVQANKKSINFEIHKPENIPIYLIGDVTRLKQILINLLGNAIKFTEKGEVILEISTMDLANNQSRIKFLVKDSGIGIGEKEQEKLFKAFTQADTSITRKFGGTGLGLAISGKLAKLMGSEVKVESELGKGSSFYFEVDFDLAGDMCAFEPKIKSNDQVETLGTKKVLLVEDNIVNIKVAKMMLMKLGIEPSLAYNGQEAVDAVKKGGYDLIFMDMQMPVMDGLQATKIIKILEHGTNTPIVAMTANVMQEDRDKCKEAGMEYFISKPVSMQALADILGEIFHS